MPVKKRQNGFDKARDGQPSCVQKSPCNSSRSTHFNERSTGNDLVSAIEDDMYDIFSFEQNTVYNVYSKFISTLRAHSILQWPKVLTFR